MAPIQMWFPDRLWTLHCTSFVATMFIILVSEYFGVKLNATCSKGITSLVAIKHRCTSFAAAMLTILSEYFGVQLDVFKHLHHRLLIVNFLDASSHCESLSIFPLLDGIYVNRLLLSIVQFFEMLTFEVANVVVLKGIFALGSDKVLQLRTPTVLLF